MLEQGVVAVEMSTSDFITNAEFAGWTRASFTAIAITEIIKRVVRICGKDLSAEFLWALSISLAGGIGILEMLMIDDRVNHMLVIIPLIMASTPVTHWVFVSNGALWIQFLVKKYTGYEMNIKNLATGREYKPRARKVIVTADGAERVVPADYDTDHSAGERTLTPEQRNREDMQ